MPKPSPAPMPRKARQLAARYTLTHCEILLREDPEAMYRLFQMSQDRPVKRLYNRPGRIVELTV